MNFIEINGNKYNLDHLVAIEEAAIEDGGTSQWSDRPSPKELTISFSGGVKLHLPLTERAQLEKRIFGHKPSK